MKKQLLSIVLMLTMLMNLIALPAAASETLDLSVSEQTAVAGGEVAVTISVANNTGLASLKFDVTYDSVLTLTGVTFNPAFGAMVTAPEPFKNPEPLTMISPLSDITANGVFATLSFTVAESAEVGHKADISITFNADDIYDGNYDNVPTTVTNGSVTVICPHRNTTDIPENPGDCDEGGYTAGVYCNDCETYISGHEPTPETGIHRDVDGAWEYDEVNHFRTCDCGLIFDSDAHSGGTATCTQKAECTVCGEEYGKVDPQNHTGKTELINTAEPDHKTQTPGYTGDEKCLGCGEIVRYGQKIDPDAHTPANIWTTDETHHWKECTVVGCGVVIDGTKATHTSEKEENKATCEKRAVCDVCGVSYGDVAPHSFTAEEKTQQALKEAGNCRDNAVYYYSCAVCGLVENDDNHTFTGDKDADVHVGGITIVNEAEADHKTQKDGYTGDAKCLGCGEIVRYGQVIPAGAHTPADTWTTDGTHHWKECTVEGCGAEIEGSRNAHSGGTATCTQKAECAVCGEEYGKVDPQNHTGKTELINTAEPDHKTQTPGYTGDAKCLGCGEIVRYGQEIDPDAHTPANIWTTDETHHWKGCTVVGCGVVIDGTKATHTSEKEENKATCEKRAVCDVCGVSYGDVAPHSFTAEEKTRQALKEAGNCRDNAVYYYSCAVCGLVENDDNHTFTGDKDADVHVGGITIVNEAEADHKAQKDGYTGDAKCLGCGEIVRYGQVIPAGAHTPADTWTTDGTHHWKECTVEGCGAEIEGSKAAHTSEKEENKATCEKRAVCDVCGVSYGDVAPHKWNDATCTEPKNCSVCGMTDGNALGHSYGTEWKSDEDSHWNECACADRANTAAHEDTDKDGKCDTCAYVVAEPGPGNPPTGDSMTVWMLLLCISALGVTAVLAYGKKRKLM